MRATFGDEEQRIVGDWKLRRETIRITRIFRDIAQEYMSTIYVGDYP